MGVVLLLALLGFAAFAIDRAVAAPDLGAPPGGRDDGESQLAVAVTLGAQLLAELAAQPHGVVTLTEHDLTVIAAQNNPHPDRYRDVIARVRNNLIAVSANTALGPMTVTVVAHVGVTLQQNGPAPQLAASVTEVDVGYLHLPGWLQDRLVGSPTIMLDPVFNNTAALRALRASIECVVVAPDGVRIGVHRPGTAADAGVCGA
jgi:hypothetical protein